MIPKQLKCIVNKGMFSDERAVTCRSLGGEISVFVPKEVVHEDNGHSTVSVRAFKEPSAWLVLLPTEDSVAIAVDASQLV